MKLPNKDLPQLRLYNARWILKITGEKSKELKQDIARGIASKYCKMLDENGSVYILTEIKRINFNNIDQKRVFGFRRLNFSCVDHKVTALEMN